MWGASRTGQAPSDHRDHRAAGVSVLRASVPVGRAGLGRAVLPPTAVAASPATSATTRAVVSRAAEEFRRRNNGAATRTAPSDAAAASQKTAVSAPNVGARTSPTGRSPEASNAAVAALAVDVPMDRRRVLRP